MPPKKQAQAGGSKKAEQKKKEKIIEVRTLPPSLSPRGAGASPAAERRSRGHVSASSPVGPGPGGRSPAPSPPAHAPSPPAPLGRPLTPARPPLLPGCSRSRGCA